MFQTSNSAAHTDIPWLHDINVVVVDRPASGNRSVFIRGGQGRRFKAIEA